MEGVAKVSKHPVHTSKQMSPKNTKTRAISVVFGGYGLHFIGVRDERTVSPAAKITKISMCVYLILKLSSDKNNRAITYHHIVKYIVSGLIVCSK